MQAGPLTDSLQQFLIVTPTNPVLDEHTVSRHALDHLDYVFDSTDYLSAHFVTCRIRNAKEVSWTTTPAARRRPSYLSSWPVQLRVAESGPGSPPAPQASFLWGARC